MGNWPPDSGTQGQWPRADLLCAVGVGRQADRQRAGAGSHRCLHFQQAAAAACLGAEVQRFQGAWDVCANQLIGKAEMEAQKTPLGQEGASQHAT